MRNKILISNQMLLSSAMNKTVEQKLTSRLEITFIIFSYPCVVEKVVFWDKIFKMEIFMDLHVFRFPESENHTFSCWIVCMCVCPCYRITPKQITTKAANLYQYLLDTFYEDRRNSLCTRSNKRIRKHYGLWTELILLYFNVFGLYLIR